MVAADMRDVADEEEMEKDDLENFVSHSERCALAAPVQSFHCLVNNPRYQRYNSIFGDGATCSQ